LAPTINWKSDAISRPDPMGKKRFSSMARMHKVARPIRELACLFQALIDWSLLGLRTNLLGAAGARSNLKKALSIAKFTSDYKTLTRMERE
jgi:hypothetical protein